MNTIALLSAFAVATAPSLAFAAERPVVVELFTSQGCSSCPPADNLLTEFANTRSDILPLSFHVTYWDQLGWRDPFGLAASTERQARYGARFGDGSYTPEMVVDGRKSLVGSERETALAAIAAARRTAGSGPVLTVERSGATVAVRVGQGHGVAKVILIGFDPHHSTRVGRGENSGRVLAETNVVRTIHTIGRWSGGAVSLTGDLPAGEQGAVLLQGENGAILSAARVGGG